MRKVQERGNELDNCSDFYILALICIDVQLILEQRYNFFMNEQKGGAFSIVAG